MTRLFLLVLLFAATTCSGCGRASSSNIMDAADQQAIDDYDKQAEENAAALSGYKEIK